MPPIETITRPRKNRISVAVPKEYGKCSFQVILVPFEQEPVFIPSVQRCPAKRRKNFVETLLSSPRLADGDALDISLMPPVCRYSPVGIASIKRERRSRAPG